MEINLLPWREREHKRKQMLFNHGVLGVMIFIGLLYGIAHLFLQSSIHQKERNIAGIKRDLMQHQNHVKTIQRMQYQIAQLQLAYQQMQAIQTQKNAFMIFVDKLLRDVPPDIQVVSLARQNGQIQLMGQTPSSDELGEWLRHFSGAQLTQMNYQVDAAVFNFQINSR